MERRDENSTRSLSISRKHFADPAQLGSAKEPLALFFRYFRGCACGGFDPSGRRPHIFGPRQNIFAILPQGSGLPHRGCAARSVAGTFATSGRGVDFRTANLASAGRMKRRGCPDIPSQCWLSGAPRLCSLSKRSARCLDRWRRCGLAARSAAGLSPFFTAAMIRA